MRILITLLFLSVLSITKNSYAISLDDLDDIEKTEDIALPLSIEWSGLLDGRLALVGSDTNWADSTKSFGGRGLTRFGSSQGGSGSGVGFHLAQFSLESAINIYDELGAHIQLNISDHKDDSRAWGSVGVVEAYIHNKHDKKISTRVGFLIPAVSLEHPEVAWSTRYTITPSAINSWVGEEIRAMGAEAKYKISKNTEFIGAFFSHNDSNGTVLAYRGWAMHDYQGTYGSRLRWNKVPVAVNHSDGWVEPFEEQDDRLGYYGKASLFSEDRAYLAEVFFYDNNAKPSAFDQTNYGWDTKFINLSVDFQFSNGVRLLSQWMSGSTTMGADKVVDADFKAFYVMTTYRIGRHRLSVRYDKFKVEDKNSLLNNVTDDNSQGHGITLAYLFHRTDNYILGIETLLIKSERNGNEGYGTSDPDDNLTQIMYRFTF